MVWSSNICVCEADIPMSVGIVEPKTHPSQLNAAEFLWDMNKRTSVFVQVTKILTYSIPIRTHEFSLCHLLGVVPYFHILSMYVCLQVHCISTEFTPRKHGGEKGVPFRIQIDTFAPGDSGEYAEHLHSASCQIKVFKVHTHSHRVTCWYSFLYSVAHLTVVKSFFLCFRIQPKGADRKQKTDREKMEKRTAQEKEKYQPSYDTTILSEVSVRLQWIVKLCGASALNLL